MGSDWRQVRHRAHKRAQARAAWQGGPRVGVRAVRRRFGDLLDVGYFNDCRFHRVVPDFIVQWGIPADPKVYQQWGENKIKDDPVRTSNKPGTLSFATSGPHARGSQMFVNFEDNSSLDDQGRARPGSRKN